MLHRVRWDAPREEVEGVRESARGGLGSVAEGEEAPGRGSRSQGRRREGRRQVGKGRGRRKVWSVRSVE